MYFVEPWAFLLVISCFCCGSFFRKIFTSGLTIFVDFKFLLQRKMWRSSLLSSTLKKSYRPLTSNIRLMSCTSIIPYKRRPNLFVSHLTLKTLMKIPLAFVRIKLERQERSILQWLRRRNFVIRCLIHGLDS